MSMELLDLNTERDLPKELAERLLKGQDTETLIAERLISRSWTRNADWFLLKPRPLFIDFVRIQIEEDRLHLQVEAEPFKFAYILPVLRFFESGADRSISVTNKRSGSSVSICYNRADLSCRLRDVPPLATIMSTFLIRIFTLQSVREFEERHIIMLDGQMMGVLESLFASWKVVHTAVCVEPESATSKRFANFVLDKEMLSASTYSPTRTLLTRLAHPFTADTAPESESLLHGASTDWLADLGAVRVISVLKNGARQGHRIEFGDELRSLRGFSSVISGYQEPRSPNRPALTSTEAFTECIDAVYARARCKRGRTSARWDCCKVIGYYAAYQLLLMLLFFIGYLILRTEFVRAHLLALKDYVYEIITTDPLYFAVFAMLMIVCFRFIICFHRCGD